MGQPKPPASLVGTDAEVPLLFVTPFGESNDAGPSLLSDVKAQEVTDFFPQPFYDPRANPVPPELDYSTSLNDVDLWTVYTTNAPHFTNKVIARSKSVCITCRKRKKKCNGTKPFCK
jgi:hypothetical protein